MKRIRIALLVGLVGSMLAPAGQASAHPSDAIRPTKAGPIIRQETTMAELREWFGEPDVRKKIRVGCVRVIKARWGDQLVVYAARTTPRPVEAIFIQERTIVSSEHGELEIHTAKKLRVGDRHRKLRRLYPKSQPITHSGHTHYLLRFGANDSRLFAKVKHGEVVQLEAWPFEFC
ncbi:MAG: hypothetical protein ACRDK3_14020 [Actinomycetota bacterium]